MSAGAIVAGGQLHVAQPGEEAVPVGAADEHDREVLDLAGLDQRQRLEQFVQRPEAAGKDHERLGILHEHRLAREEVVELDATVDIRVERLLERQLDVQPTDSPLASCAPRLAASICPGRRR